MLIMMVLLTKKRTFDPFRFHLGFEKIIDVDLLSYKWKFAAWITQALAVACFYPISRLTLMWFLGEEYSEYIRPLLSWALVLPGIIFGYVSFICFQWSIVYDRKNIK